MPHCSHTTHNPVTTASHLNLFLFFFCIQSKNRGSSRRQDFRSQSLKIPETRRALVKVRTHPAHAPGLLLVLSKLDTPSNQQQIQPRRCLSDTTTHHNTLGPCVPQKSHFGGVMASNGGSLRGEGGGEKGRGVITAGWGRGEGSHWGQACAAASACVPRRVAG